MKINWIYRTLRFLKKVYFSNDKRVAAYLVCVAMATVFWFLNALSKTYTIDLVAPVKYVNYPNNKTLSNTPPAEFELTVRAHGFTLIRQELSFLFLPLQFDVNALTNNRMIDSKKNYFIITHPLPRTFVNPHFTLTKIKSLNVLDQHFDFTILYGSYHIANPCAHQIVP